MRSDAKVKVDGAAIRAWREAAGFTREQAAAMAGVASRTIYAAEALGLMSANTHQKLIKVLGPPSANTCTDCGHGIGSPSRRCDDCSRKQAVRDVIAKAARAAAEIA